MSYQVTDGLYFWTPQSVPSMFPSPTPLDSHCRAHLEDHDVVQQECGVEAILENALHAEGLSGGLLPP
jgi:hypothetical protein